MPLCPLNVVRYLLVYKLHKIIVKSSLADNKSLPSRENATEYTPILCYLNIKGSLVTSIYLSSFFSSKLHSFNSVNKNLHPLTSDCLKLPVNKNK